MLLGIDYASVDGNKQPNYDLVRREILERTNGQSRLGFVIMRGTYSTIADPTFKRDWASLKTAGITRGAYMFLVYPKNGAMTVSQPEVQARAFVSAVGALDPDDLPPVLDVEFPGGNKMGARAALEWTLKAYRVLRDSYKTPPMIYTSARVWHEDLQNIDCPEIAESPAWLAKPWPYAVRSPAKLNPTALVEPTRTHFGTLKPWGDASNWWIQQYQGDALGFPGFDKTVDINRFNPMSMATVKGGSDRVRWMQRRLDIIADGLFGPRTLSALQAFQRASGLDADGVVGPKTFARLCWQPLAELSTP